MVGHTKELTKVSKELLSLPDSPNAPDYRAKRVTADY